MNVPIAVRLLVTLLLVAAIVTMSVVPGTPQPGDSVFAWLVSATPTPLQKLMHLISYATLAMLLIWTFERIDSMSLRVVLALLVGVSLGSFLEWYQTSVPRAIRHAGRCYFECIRFGYWCAGRHHVALNRCHHSKRRILEITVGASIVNLGGVTGFTNRKPLCAILAWAKFGGPSN